MVCHCTPPTDPEELGCGEECFNRLLYYECDPRTCPCGDRCGNRRIQQAQFVSQLDVFDTIDRGFGLRTLQDIPAGQMITEYRGEVISAEECENRRERLYKGQENLYFLEYDRGDVLDAGLKGTDARYVNHR